MVASVHRFLHRREPDSPESTPVWVLYGPGVGDIVYHDILHGCVELRRSVELWAIHEWGNSDGGLPPITVTLTGSGTLDFSGNDDPREARARFDRMRSSRPPRYGQRRPQRTGTAEEGPATETDEAQAAGAGAAQRLQASLGDGQALVNHMNQIAAAMESDHGERILVVVERFAEHLTELETLNQAGNVLEARRVLEERWLRTLSQHNALLVFLALNQRALEHVIGPDHPAVRWQEIQGPKAEEISEALVRISRRRGFTVRDPGAVGANLERYNSLRFALGNPARVVRRGLQVSMETVMDLPPVDESRVARILEELDALVGLDQVKEKARGVVANARARRRRLDETGRFPDETMHLIFSGGPGTGKTTVARLFAQLYHALGVLPSDQVLEFTASQGIMSPTVGQTELNMQRTLESGLGGVVFIDEAHAFGDHTDGRAKEAIQALVPMAWNNRNNMVIILAGYGDRIPDVLKMDDGMPRRFPLHGRLEFSDYTDGELWEILSRKLVRDGWSLAADTEPALRALLQRRTARSGFGNAGGVDNLVSEIIQRHDSRPGASPGVIAREDLPASVVRHEKQLGEAQRALDTMVGLGEVRGAIRRLVDRMAYDLQEGDTTRRGALTLQFVGPPGTGKTTVARLMADMLYGVGALSRNTLVEVGGSGLRGLYQGHTTAKVRELVEKARDGVLFIDEAYGMVTSERDDFGQEALTELMRQVTLPDNGDTVFILAGYEDQLDNLMTFNQGMSRRFGSKVRFENFTPPDCVELARRKLTEERFTPGEGFLDAFQLAAGIAISAQGAHFGNAGWAATAVDSALERMRGRVLQANIPVGDPLRRTVLVEDLEAALGISLAGEEPMRSMEEISAGPADSGTQGDMHSDGGLGVTAALRGGWRAPEAPVPLPVASDILTDRSRAAQQLIDSSVHLVVDIGQERHGGTGFMVTPHGLLVTSAHVVRGGRAIEALLGPDWGSCAAEVVLTDDDADLALLAVPTPTSPPKPVLPLGVSANLPSLRPLIVVGNAQVEPGEPPRVVEVRVARNSRLDREHFETDGAIEAGFSGGPVLDPQQGAAVGVAIGGRGENVRVIVRIERVREMLTHLGYHFEQEIEPW